MSHVDANRQRMVQLLTSLNAPEGIQPSLVEGVRLLRTTRSSKPVPVLYEPCIVIVAQGRKYFRLPDQVITYGGNQYLLLTVPVPADCETEVAAEGPFLALSVRIDLAVLSELLISLRNDLPPQAPKTGIERVRAPQLTPELSDVSVRLLECCLSPVDAKVLGPALVREFFYRILIGSDGGALRDLVLGSSQQIVVHRILDQMHRDFKAPLDITALARKVGISASGLFQHFKEVTGTSPVQYLKLVRLHKARQLMVQASLSAAAAAEGVGYASQSQFSREFRRLFGYPPLEEAQRIKATFGFKSDSIFESSLVTADSLVKQAM